MSDLGQFNPVSPVWHSPPSRKPAVKRRSKDSEKSHQKQMRDKIDKSSDDDSDQPHIDEYA